MISTEAQLTIAEYIFFSSTHGMFTRIKHTTGYKTNLSKFLKISIIPTVFINYNGFKLDINNLR